jgi:hypothetical protein
MGTGGKYGGNMGTEETFPSFFLAITRSSNPFLLYMNSVESACSRELHLHCIADFGRVRLLWEATFFRLQLPARAPF